MNKAYYALIPILFVVGFFAYSNRTFLIDTVKPVTSVLSLGFAKAQDTWNTIPSSIKGVITLGIPIATTVFFAWASSLWRKKAQQTEVLASQQQTQLRGQIDEANTIIGQRDERITLLESQPGGASTLELREAKFYGETLEDQLKKKITTINELHKKIEKLELDIRALQIRNKELTTIA